MKILYFDCVLGISGDMTLGALLDLYGDREAFLLELEKLGLEGEWRMQAEKTVKFGITGTDVDVITPDHSHNHEHEHRHRGFSDIKKIIGESRLHPEVKKTALDIFLNLAQAEAKVHGTTPDEVHFHEVGAVDAILDITGTAILVNLLKPDKIYCSPINTGSGTIHCMHGELPVPGPAVSELLQGFRVFAQGRVGEKTTPTGAAILRTLCTQTDMLPPMRLEKTGYGFGKKDYGTLNALRVFAGETAEETREVCVLEANIDDMTGEALGAAMQVMMEAGALDCFFTPVYMKKQRPAYMLSVMTRPEDREKFEKLIFTHTTTIGIRNTAYNRAELNRTEKTAETTYGPVRVKITEGYGVTRVKPEYADIISICEKNSLPFDTVYRAVTEQLINRI